MAEKRMFSNKVIGSDLFLEMPDSTQNLYFHLSMYADDDGFVDKPKSIMRMIGKKEDDFKILLAKNFIIPFESGVIVIKHWRINNYLRSDRYHETIYKKEKKELVLNDKGEYEKVGIPSGIPYVNPIYSISNSNSISNTNIYKDIIDYLNEKADTNFKPTTKKTQTLIKARLNENFKLEDFKVVIDKKCQTWKNTKMQQYLRPETLFGTKFESYLNENVFFEKKGNFENREYNKEQINNLFDNLNDI